MSAPQQIKDGLSLDFGPLRIIDLATAFEELHTLSGVASGIACQPRCHRSEHEYNAVGDIFDDISERFNEELDRIVKEITARIPADESERRARAYVILANELFVNDDPLQSLEAVRPLITGTVETPPSKPSFKVALNNVHGGVGNVGHLLSTLSDLLLQLDRPEDGGQWEVICRATALATIARDTCARMDEAIDGDFAEIHKAAQS